MSTLRLADHIREAAWTHGNALRKPEVALAVARAVEPDPELSWVVIGDGENLRHEKDWDFFQLAHRWRQREPFGAFLAAHRVVEDNPGGFSDPEEFRRFLSCFDDPRKNKKRSRSIPLRNRRRVLATGECAACGATEDLAVDHKVPFSRGGSHHITNLQCLCRSCNSSKGARTPEEWQYGAD